MVLIHAVAVAAGMLHVRCSHCGHAQKKQRSRSGRYICTRCHHAFSPGGGATGKTLSSRARKSIGKRS